jgi:phage-related protein
MATSSSREIVFLGSSKDDVTAFPLPVKRVMGYALRLAQQGERHPDTKPMVGFKGARVLEIRDDHDSDTYRTMYTVSLGDVVYVLHAFQKKSTQGIETPQRHIDTIEQRLKQAKELHTQRERERKEGKE